MINPESEITIDQLLRNATSKLKRANIDSASLDSKILLEYVTNKDRSWLIRHSNDYLDHEKQNHFFKLVDLRSKRHPVAYLTNSKEFYGHQFIVNSDVLIPRPESEQLIDEVSRLLELKPGSNIADVGTGSGCLAISTKLKHPTINIIASDISPKALSLASQNSNLHNTEITLIESDLLASYPEKPQFDIIIANLPYVDKAWPELNNYPELNYEPKLALFAKDSGLELIKKLLAQAPGKLKPYGFLILEMDTRQLEKVSLLANHFNLKEINRQPFMLTLQLLSKN